MVESVSEAEKVDFSALSPDDRQSYLDRLAAEAEAASKAGDWETAIARLRALERFDRTYHGVEAKLAMALRMRQVSRLYQEGKALLAAGQYVEAVTALREAYVRGGGTYKDVGDLLLQAQAKLAETASPAPAVNSQRPGCLPGLALLLSLFRH